MIERSAALAVLVVLLAAVVAPVAGAHQETPTILDAQAANLVTIRAGSTSKQPRPILSPRAAPRSGDPLSVVATADIQVTYTGFSAQARDAFEAAVSIWETMVVSPRVIHVNASWQDLGTGVLGAAGPSAVYKIGDGFAHPAALAEAKCDCEGSVAHEIDAYFNSAFGAWYLGTDGNAPGDRYDFMTVVMHELGHGLGFISSFDVGGGEGSWGYFNPRKAFRYDLAEYGAPSGGQPLTHLATYPNPSAALAAELTDGSVYFGGSNVVAVLGERAALYAPNPWDGGSSNSHFDEDAFPTGTQHALMTPFIANGEVIHDPGPLTLALFRDIGWSTSGEGAATAPGAPEGVAAVPGNAEATVSWSGPASDGGRVITNYTVTASPDGQACQTAGATSCTVTGLTNGVTYTFTVIATNSVGPGPASMPSNAVTPDPSADTIGPTVGMPAVAFLSGGTLGAPIGVHVEWPPTTDPSGIERYELEYRKGSGAWIPVALATETDTFADTTLPKTGKSYRWRVRAIDGVGNAGDWSITASALLKLKQEDGGSVAYSRGWKAAPLAGAARGYVRHSSTEGRWARLTFTGTSAAFVSTLGPGRGIADMWLDGAYVGFVDLYAAQPTTRAIAWSTGALAPGSHTLEIFVSGARNPASTSDRIDIDAFLIWRRP